MPSWNTAVAPVWGRGRVRVGMYLGAAMLLVVVTGFWAYDQGGLLWFLLILLLPVGALLAGLVPVGIGFAVSSVLRQRRLLTWRHGRPFGVYVVLLMLVWAIFQIAPIVSRSSERSMIANFHRHEAEFHRLAEMAE